MKVLSLDDASAQVQAYLRSKVDETVTVTTDENADDFEVLISGRLTEKLLTQSAKLQRVILPWTGIPNAFREILQREEFAHIVLHNSHYNAPVVAELTFTMLLAAMKNLSALDRTLRQGDWRLRYAPSRAFSFRNKTALILGYGAIGRKIAQLLQPLGFSILATRNSLAEKVTEDGVEIYPSDKLHDLLPDMDVLIVALPLTDETKGMVGSAEIAALPKRAIVVNIGRGPIIDEEALFTALKNGDLHAAALDVWYQYPKDEASRATTHPSKFPFYELDNVVMAPHVGSALADEEDLYLRMDDIAEMLNAYATSGEMPNQVDLARGY